jgi:hypothetical protein
MRGGRVDLIGPLGHRAIKERRISSFEFRFLKKETKMKIGFRIQDSGSRKAGWAAALFLLLSAFCFLPSGFGQTATPYGLTFPAGILGVAEATQATTLTNNLTVTLSSITVSVTGTNSSDFSVATSPGSSCGGSLAAAATCTLTVTFTPGGLGSRVAYISVVYSGSPGSPMLLPLAGWGWTGASGGPGTLLMANASSTGTTLNSLAKSTGAPSTAVIATTSDNKSGVVLGIVTSGAGTTGNAVIQTSGAALCNFDGATTANDVVTVSIGTNGDCTDVGATLPGDGSQLIGHVLSTNGAGGAYLVALSGLGVPGSGATATGASFQSAPTPSVAAGETLGTAALPFGNLYFGNAAADSSSFGATFTGHRVFTWPDASITVSGAVLTDCGTSASCAAPTTRSSTLKIAIGSHAMTAGVLAITGISPAFTSTASFTCAASDPSNPYTITAVNGSGSAVTFTASTTSGNTDTVSWACVGY